MISIRLETATSSRLLELAEAGDANAQFELFRRLSLGRRAEDQPEQACQWYGRAASQGHPAALWRAGMSSELVDDPLGVHWIRQAAERGFAAAQVCLAARYLNGNGVPRDVALAVQWLVRAAEQGEASASYKLGQLQDEGATRGIDERPSAFWYRLAADQYRDLWLQRAAVP